MKTIQILETEEEILSTYKLLSELHPNVSSMGTAYVAYVRRLQTKHGFQLAGIRDAREMLCVSGFRVCENLGWGRYLYVDDLITDERWRSMHVGSEMLNWLITRARLEQCAELRLDARVDRDEAHRFYLREGMEIGAYNFRLAL